jgi:hypothetical protein
MKCSLVFLLASLAACQLSTSYSGPRPRGAARSSSSSSAPAATATTTTAVEGESTQCDAAHDHCLEAETWFALSYEEGQARDAPIYAYPGKYVQQGSDLPWLIGYRCDCPVGGYGVRAVRATRDNVAVDRRVVVYFGVFDEAPEVPNRELRARTEKWRVGVVTRVDAARGEFEMTSYNGRVPFGAARVVVEMRQRVPERTAPFPVPFKDPAP